jgi:catechol 2,3-dioxygenase-like lactoylglutathione lyase family enzyme
MLRNQSHRIGRREALALLAGGTFVSRARAATSEQPFRFSRIDHVEFWVSNPESSAAFYARIFGNAVLKNNKTARRYVKLGPAFIAMDKGAEARVDHFCAGIESFDVAEMHQYLEQRGIPYKDYPSGKDLYVTDPDGIRLQLGAAESWKQLVAGTASPESLAVGGEPLFEPESIDHILLNVSEPEKSVAFYERIFGPVTQRNNNRIWFQAGPSRIGLLQAPAGHKPGVNHYCVGAPAFDYATATRKLEQAGAKIGAPEVAGAPEFRDPDGLLVQVMAPRSPRPPA